VAVEGVLLQLQGSFCGVKGVVRHIVYHIAFYSAFLRLLFAESFCSGSLIFFLRLYIKKVSSNGKNSLLKFDSSQKSFLV
jgi:hypothetical protein